MPEKVYVATFADAIESGARTAFTHVGAVVLMASMTTRLPRKFIRPGVSLTVIAIADDQLFSHNLVLWLPSLEAAQEQELTLPPCIKPFMGSMPAAVIGIKRSACIKGTVAQALLAETLTAFHSGRRLRNDEATLNHREYALT